MKIKQSDIATAIGVSVSQVSRALSNRKRVSPELAERIKEAAERLHYRNDSPVHHKTAAILYQTLTPKVNENIYKLRKELESSGFAVMILPEKATFLESVFFDSCYKV